MKSMIEGFGSNKIVLFLTTAVLLLFVYSIVSNVLATDTVQASVTVQDVGVTVGTVSCAGDIVSSKTNYTVYCWAQLTDNNSYQDIEGCNGTMFLTSSGYAGANDNDERYHNTSCSRPGGSGINQWCNCTLKFAFWADDGSWSGRIYGWDSEVDVGSGSGYNTKTGHTITQNLGIEITGSLAFGTMKIGDTKNCGSCSNCDVMVNDTGNNPIGIQLAAVATNYSCSGVSGGAVNLTISTTKYSNTDDTAYGSCAGTITTSSGDTHSEIASSAFGLVDIDDTGYEAAENTKYVYWGINIPAGTMGTCGLTINPAAIAV